MSTSIESNRIVALDQFRGAIVLTAIVVSYLSSFSEIPRIFKHHGSHLGLADLVMPGFFLAMGFSYRLTFLKRVGTLGLTRARIKVLKRVLLLSCIAILLYTPGKSGLNAGDLSQLIKRNWFQTILQIAFTILWLLPVIGKSGIARISYAALSMTVFTILSTNFYFNWVHSEPRSIDGGPLGFLSWSSAAVLGSVIYDVVLANSLREKISLLTAMLIFIALGCLIAALGNGNSSDGIPFLVSASSDVTSPWNLNQRGATLSYMLFSCGCVGALCLAMCELFRTGKIRNLAVLDLLGRNALLVYIFKDSLLNVVLYFLPSDSSISLVLLGGSILLLMSYAFYGFLDSQKIRLAL